MTKLEEIKNQVAYENNWRDWDDAPDIRQLQMWPEVNRRHARECCKATLEKAAENAQVCIDGDSKGTSYGLPSNEFIEVDKSSITNPDNICIL